jgi:PAS domain S-box-containing protein
MLVFPRPFSIASSAWRLLACGLIASCALFLWVYQLEQRNEQAGFERRALHRIAAVQRGMERAVDALQDVNQLFVTNGRVSREQFHTFTRSLHARHPYIEAFAFHRLVSQAERPAYEAQMRKSFPHFAIATLVDGNRVAADIKDQYRVIDFVEPVRHSGLIGLEESPNDDAVRRADETGRPAATGIFPLYIPSPGIRIAMAVYRDGRVPDDLASRRRSVLGHTVIVLRAGELIEKMLESSDAHSTPGLDMRVYAATSPEASKLLYGTPKAGPDRFRPGWFSWDALTPVSRSFDVAGRSWHMTVTAQPAPFFTTHDGALFALFTGLLITLAVAAYLHSAESRERHIQQLVAQRTEQLRQLNDLLTEDIQARRRAEQALVLSEARARELAELSSDSAWEQDAHFRFISYFTEEREELGRFAKLSLGVTRWELPVDPDSADWAAHRATLEAHRPFKDFEYRLLVEGWPAQWISTSGRPQFDADGNFTGYLGTSRDITDRKQAEEGLRQSRSELRQLAAHRERIREDERKRIARDIHDELGQSLLVLRLDVARMAARPAVTSEQFAATLNQIDTAIKGVRAIINDLRPAVLDLGLHAAIQWQAKEFERRSGIPCEVHIDHEEFSMEDQHATALFRSVQESLSNILRHAHASQVWIDMHRKDSHFHLKVSDDGVGLHPGRPRGENTFGLIGIEERMNALGGRAATASEPGQGMSVVLTLPISA